MRIEFNTGIYFISWAPNPDPLYHAPQKSPSNMPIIPPLPRTPIEVDGYMVSLDHLIGGRAKNDFRRVVRKKGLHYVLHFKGPIFLDSGGYQNRIRKPADVLDLQSVFKPDFVVHMDSMGNWKTTIRNAKMAKEFEECYNFKISYAIQGNTVDEYLKCAKELLRLKCDRFAIGNLARLSERKKVDDVVNVISSIRKVLGQKPLHVLGVSNVKILEKVKPYITSFDSSSAIQLATMRKSVLELKNGIVKDIRDWEGKPTNFNCECNVCKNFDVFQDEHRLPVGTGERRVIRYLRAIHNAYIIWKVVRSS